MTTETENIEETTEVPAKGRPGAKPQPLTAASKRYEKAKSRADKARAAHQKVVDVTERLHSAEAEEAEALDALEEELAKLRGDIA